MVDVLQAELLRPEVTTAFLEAFHAEQKSIAQKAVGHKRDLTAKMQRKMANQTRLIDGVADGSLDMKLFGAKVATLAEEIEQISLELEQLEIVEAPIELHPSLLIKYQKQLTDLHTVLQDQINAGDLTGVEAIRELIEQVTVYEGREGAGSVEVHLQGKLNALIGHDGFIASDDVYGGSGRGT